MPKRYYPARHELSDPQQLERVTRDIYDKLYAIQSTRDAATRTTTGGASITRRTSLPVTGATFHASGVFPPASGATTPTASATSIVTVTAGSTTLYPANDVILCNAAAGTVTLVLPAVATSGGQLYEIKKIDTTTNTVVVDPNASELIEDETTLTLSLFGEAVTIICNASKWWII